MIKNIAPVFILAFAGILSAETPEDTPTNTKEIAFTSWGSSTTSSGPTTCTLGDLVLPVFGVKNPLCKLSAAAGTLRYATLDFPPTAKTCVVVIANQPNEIDEGDIAAGRPLTIRFPYTRLGGSPGSSSGGVCTGECSVVTARVFSQVDGTVLNAPTYGLPYESDNLPNGGPNFPGKKITAAVRGIQFTVNKRNPLLVEICRDPGNVRDTSTGTLRIANPLSIVWPVIGTPAAALPEAAATGLDIQ